MEVVWDKTYFYNCSLSVMTFFFLQRKDTISPTFMSFANEMYCFYQIHVTKIIAIQYKLDLP